MALWITVWRTMDRLVANFRVNGAKLHLSIPQQRRPETRIVDSHTLRAWPAADRPAMLDPTCLSRTPGSDDRAACLRTEQLTWAWEDYPGNFTGSWTSSEQRGCLRPGCE